MRIKMNESALQHFFCPGLDTFHCSQRHIDAVFLDAWICQTAGGFSDIISKTQGYLAWRNQRSR